MREGQRKVGLAIVAGLVALLVLAAGITYPRAPVEVEELGYTNFTGLDVAAPTTYATGTPAVVFNNLGLGVPLEVQDAGTPVASFYDGGMWDLHGNQFDLDADGDTSITVSTDDQIDLEIAGSDEVVLTAASLDLNNTYIDQDIQTENLMLPTVISTSIAYDAGSGTVVTVADGEMWFVHAVFAQVTSNFNCTGDDCTLDVGDGTDTDGLLDLDDGELQAADTEGTGAPAGWQGFMSTDTRGAFLANGHGFIYAPDGAAETIDYAVGGTSPAAGQAYVYVVYTRFK